MTSYFAYLWHNFVLNVAPLPLASCFHFAYLKSQAFQSKDSFTFCLYSVLHNCPSSLAVCKTLQGMNKIIIQQRVSEKKMYLPSLLGTIGKQKKKKKKRRLTDWQCFFQPPHNWSMRRRRYKIEKPNQNQFKRKCLY